MPNQKSLMNVAMDLMKEGFTKINQAMGYLEEEERIRKEFLESFNKVFSATPKTRVTQKVVGKTTKKNGNSNGRPPAEWASHAFNLLHRERKCNELQELLSDLGFLVQAKTLSTFLLRKTEEGVLLRVARGRYQMAPRQ